MTASIASTVHPLIGDGLPFLYRAFPDRRLLTTPGLARESVVVRRSFVSAGNTQLGRVARSQADDYSNDDFGPMRARTERPTRAYHLKARRSSLTEVLQVCSRAECGVDNR